MGQSQGETVPPRSAACPTMVQNLSHHGTQTQCTQRTQRKIFVPVFDSKEFQTAWTDFLEHRKEKRSPVKAKSYDLLSRKLKAMGEPAAVLALQTSIENGWTGVFPPKSDRTQARKSKGIHL
jgi:hypothetical protein